MSWCLIYFWFFWLNVISVLAPWGAAASYLCSPAQRMSWHEAPCFGQEAAAPRDVLLLVTLWMLRWGSALRKQLMSTTGDSLKISTLCQLLSEISLASPISLPCLFRLCCFYGIFRPWRAALSAVSAVCAGLSMWLSCSTEIWASH